jgi:hypothetical protein
MLAVLMPGAIGCSGITGEGLALRGRVPKVGPGIFKSPPTIFGRIGVKVYLYSLSLNLENLDA